jgi:formylglycine-generating enzyme required for sulfatase activity
MLQRFVPQLHSRRFTALSLSCAVAFATLATCAHHAAARYAGVPDSDFQWATITDAGNPAYGGGPNGELAGRGSVGYDYRISRLELTSGQFLEFVNSAWKSSSTPMPAWFIGSSGIQPGLQGPYHLRDDIPNAAMVPVIGLNWRVAAQYCNWLHNDKSSDPSALLSGAYDVSTFGTNPDGTFTDQLTHSPDAKFWIPTLDEWMKAAHYDPNRYGTGEGGWWESPNGTDVPLISGPPGIGQTSGAGTFQWSSTPVYIPLGSYADVQSPWGLWDVSGGASEWTEEVFNPGFPQDRGLDGSWAGASVFSANLDLVHSINSFPPQAPGFAGLRVASAVPGPSCLGILAIGFAFRLCRRRRRELDQWTPSGLS